MPRNPDKRRCEVPGCRAWAMRGHTRCRAHRDAELGPRGAGAPPGNLNALKHGRYSHPLPPPDLERLADRLVQRPQDLPYRVGLAARAVQDRADDPLMALVALRRLLTQLIPLVAARLFALELRAFFQHLPARLRAPTLDLIRRSVPRDSPEERLLLLRKLEKTIDGTVQLMGPGPP